MVRRAGGSWRTTASAANCHHQSRGRPLLISCHAVAEDETHRSSPPVPLLVARLARSLWYYMAAATTTTRRITLRPTARSPPSVCVAAVQTTSLSLGLRPTTLLLPIGHLLCVATWLGMLVAASPARLPPLVLPMMAAAPSATSFLGRARAPPPRSPCRSYGLVVPMMHHFFSRT
jgi:hypothetical protein